MNTTIADGKLRQCYKCGFFATTPETKCPDCSRPLKSSSLLRALGVVMMMCGIFLVVVMSYLTFWIARASHTSDGFGGTRYNGTPEQLLMIYALFGFIVVFGILAFAGGTWQVVFGKRNKTFVRTMLAATFILYIGAMAFYWAFVR